MRVPPRRPRTALGLALAAATVLAPTGCDQPTGSTRPRARAKANIDPADVVPEAPAPPPAPAPRKFIVGETTQDVRDMSKEQKAGAVVKTPRISSKDPITLPGNAYVSIIGQTSMGRITHDLDLYQATNGEYPQTLEEFMDKIVKPNGISLPLLPSYQKYGYDAPNHKLIILEYPDLKDGPN